MLRKQKQNGHKEYGDGRDDERLQFYIICPGKA